MFWGNFGCPFLWVFFHSQRFTTEVLSSLINHLFNHSSGEQEKATLAISSVQKK